MASIVIRDLSESSELDRQAMLAIAGGGRVRVVGAGMAAGLRDGVPRARLFELAPGGRSRSASGPVR